MRVNAINSYNYSKNNLNQRNVSGYAEINFSGNKQALVAVAKDDFKTETAKRLYSTIQKWFKIIGNSGKIEDVKILSEEIEMFDEKFLKKVPVNFDTLISIRKDTNRALLNMYRVLPGKKKQRVFSADIDRDGQMVCGEYSLYSTLKIYNDPYNNLKFVRDGNNVRRINSYRNGVYLPHGDNDKEWGLPPEVTPVTEENSTYGLFEIFIELARLHTSLYK